MHLRSLFPTDRIASTTSNPESSSTVTSMLSFSTPGRSTATRNVSSSPVYSAYGFTIMTFGLLLPSPWSFSLDAPSSSDSADVVVAAESALKTSSSSLSLYMSSAPLRIFPRTFSIESRVLEEERSLLSSDAKSNDFSIHFFMASLLLLLSSPLFLFPKYITFRPRHLFFFFEESSLTSRRSSRKASSTSFHSLVGLREEKSPIVSESLPKRNDSMRGKERRNDSPPVPPPPLLNTNPSA